MHRLLIFLSVVIGFIAFIGLGAAFLVFVGVPFVVALLIMVFLSLGYGWVLLSFFHYRYIRQEEFHHLLASAADAQAPLAPAVWAYVHDRPRSTGREAFIAALMMILPGYYWIWHRRNSFDQKVRRVALRLEAGYPLYQALLAVPGVASRETIMAAAIGQSTGQLARCLKLAPGWRLTHVWIAAIPRILYPALLLVLMTAATAFLLVFIIPKFEKIFSDLGRHQPSLRLPEATESFIRVGRWFVLYGWQAIPLLLGLACLLIASSTAAWYCPGVGRLYRMHARGRLLRMLAIMLEAGDTVPEALGLLADAGYFRGTVQRRLRKVRALIEQGEPLPDSLYREGLLPESMLPLLQAAERARNLPWAMLELGEHLGSRSVNLSQRITAAVFPLTVIMVGLVVGLMVVAMFLPLVTLITELAR